MVLSRRQSVSTDDARENVRGYPNARPTGRLYSYSILRGYAGPRPKGRLDSYSYSPPGLPEAPEEEEETVDADMGGRA